ncbi:MAG: hypothetical protein ACYSSN_06870 [Planctomycetota bacterium]|jgi:major membrane immunogen (membrane-anchored lipoprotein)
MKVTVRLLIAVLPLVMLHAQPAIAQEGHLQVIIQPQEAIDGGAQWRVGSPPWHDSGYTEPNLAVGSYTVRFKGVDGWNTPANETVEIYDGNTTIITGTYTQQTGSLQVTISPQAAIDAGAQWRVDGGAWRDSNDTEPNIAVGSYTVEYKPISNWNGPNSETVQINDGQTTTTSGTYIQAGSLQVTIAPQEAIDANAQWRVDGGTWQNSGYTEPNLAIGSHTVEYKPISNWNEPNSETIQINFGQTTATSGTYIQTGSAQVTISPPEAITAGAQWRVDGGTWQDSNDIVTNLTTGFHTVEYKPISNWNEPNSETLLINFAQTTATSGTYTQAGSLQVTISPPEAITAGAQWRIDGGIWLDSGYTETNLDTGPHTVEYSVIAGWNEPNSETVTINFAQTTSTSGTYIQQLGSLQVTISPQAAIDANAQWRVDGGAWHDSNDTEPNLTVGPHTVEYKPITNWNEPNSQTVQINDGQTTATTGTYIQAGSLQVTILPPAAIVAGAQWRVDGGIWRDSNDIESNLAIGLHTVEYKPLINWKEPNSETLLINFAQTTTTSGTYTQAGSLQVTILPQGAVTAGAQWRVNSGPWHDSNDIENSLTAGSYTVDYKPVTGWNEPNSETIQINDGQTTTTTGTYTAQSGSLEVTIIPQEAIDANAQWRVDLTRLNTA